MSLERTAIRKVVKKLLSEIAPDKIKVFDTPTTHLQDDEYPALRFFVKSEDWDTYTEVPLVTKRRIILAVECHARGSDGTIAADERDHLMHLVEEKLFQSNRLEGTVEELQMMNPTFLQSEDGNCAAHFGELNFACIIGVEHPRQRDLNLPDFLTVKTDFDLDEKDGNIELEDELTLRE